MKRIVLVACVIACQPPNKASPSPTPSPTAAPKNGPLDDDRAELAGASADADGLVVRTCSGKLIRYDRNLRMIAAAAPSSKVVALALPFAALDNGDIVRVDAALTLSPVGRASQTPLWIGSRGGDAIAFFERDRRYAIETIHEGKTSTFEITRDKALAQRIGHPSTFLLDHDTLWFGVDAGEWGGWIGKIDLKTMKLTSPSGRKGDPSSDDPVMGFATHPDGRVLAHGGMIHMGLTNGSINAIVGGTLVPVWKREGFDDKQPENPPALPVVSIQPNGERMRILVWDELYDVSGDFKEWSKIASIPARTRSGRPDSVGDYPAVVAIVDLGDELVFATTLDGLFVFKDGKISPQ